MLVAAVYLYNSSSLDLINTCASEFENCYSFYFDIMVVAYPVYAWPKYPCTNMQAFQQWFTYHHAGPHIAMAIPSTVPVLPARKPIIILPTSLGPNEQHVPVTCPLSIDTSSHPISLEDLLPQDHTQHPALVISTRNTPLDQPLFININTSSNYPLDASRFPGLLTATHRQQPALVISRRNSSVPVDQPLQINTHSQYKLDASKFPGLRTTQHARQPALLLHSKSQASAILNHYNGLLGKQPSKKRKREENVHKIQKRICIKKEHTDDMLVLFLDCERRGGC